MALSDDVTAGLRSYYDYYAKVVDIKQNVVTFSAVDPGVVLSDGKLNCVAFQIPYRDISAVGRSGVFDWREDKEVFQITKIEATTVDSVVIGQGGFTYSIRLDRGGHFRFFEATISGDWYDRYQTDDDEAVFDEIFGLVPRSLRA